MLRLEDDAAPNQLVSLIGGKGLPGSNRSLIRFE